MANRKMAMFDFDGVLVNTIEFGYQIHKEFNPGFTYEEFQNFSNGNFYEGVGKAIADGHIDPGKENFKNRYDEHVSKINVHDVLHNTIIELSKIYDLSIVSSMFNNSIKQFLEKEKIAEHFKEIMGADFHRSKVIKIKTLLEKYNLKPNEAVLITDSLGDILEANECSVPSIGVLWGIHPHGTLEKGKPAKIIENPLDLFDSVKEILG